MDKQTDIIQPLSAELQQRVINQTQVYIELARDLLGIKQRPVEIKFNLKGRCAGMYRVYRHAFSQKRKRDPV